MSYTPDTTNGQATITVNTATQQVSVTHRVRSAGGNVVWSVFNATPGGGSVRVCVQNIMDGGAPLPSNLYDFFPPGKNCVDVAPGNTGVLHVKLNGPAGSVYTYDVAVNGNVAVDPELEI